MAENIPGTVEPAPNSRGRIIMVVDSNANDLFYTSILLQRLGYQVCSAKTVEDALAMLSAALPAVIITELNLSPSNSMSSLERFRQDPRTASLPVIVLSRSGDMIAKKRCLEAGAADFLTKPIRADELYRTVQTVIEPNPRERIRIQTSIPLSLDNAPLDYKAGECGTMLSEQGMYVRTLKTSPAKTTLSVTMTIKGRTISLEAELLYSQQLGQGPAGQPGMGLKFVRISPEDQEFIKQYIHEEVAGDIAPKKR